MPFMCSKAPNDNGQVVTMTLAGELDAASAPAFMAELKQAFQQAPRHLVLVVSELSFIASAGIRALLFAIQGVRGLDIYLIAPQEQIVDTIDKVGIRSRVIIQDEYRPSA
jgi:anti-anti-sigma factor